jgi:hypothetical protein
VSIRIDRPCYHTKECGSRGALGSAMGGKGGEKLGEGIVDDEGMGDGLFDDSMIKLV